MARLWSAEGTPIIQFGSSQDFAQDVIVAPEKTQVLTLANQGSAALFDLASGRRMAEFRGHTKRILKDTFRDVLPDELYTRPKRGFEVPLLKWFRTGLKPLIEDDLLSYKFISEQGIFDLVEIQKLKRQLFSSNPGDVHARIWGLIVFQYWYKKYFA